MDKQDLTTLKNLYYQAKDAFNSENSDHNHLRDALIDVAAILYREGEMDAGVYYAECESLEPKAPETDFADENVK